MEALWLQSQQVAHSEMSRLTGISSTTLTSSLRAYQEGGLEALNPGGFYRPPRDVGRPQETVAAYFREHPPTSVKHARATIATLTGVRRSPNRVRLCLKPIGLKCRQVGMIPAKADAEVQDAFKKAALEPRLEEAQAGHRAVCFVAAAHVVLAPC